MVHLRDLAFVIICSLILYNVKLSTAFPTGSTLSYKEIKNGIQKEVSHIADPIKQVEKLTGIAAQEKFDHQRTKEERLKEREERLKERLVFMKYAEENLKKAESAIYQKANCEKVLRIVAARSKLDGVVDKTYPLEFNNKTGETIYGKPDGKSYCDSLHEMIHSEGSQFTNDPYVIMFRDRIAKRNISNASFMKAARWLYNLFSDKSYHKMAQFAPPLPRYDDVNGIHDMLKVVEVDEDIPAVVCIQIILQPFGLPPNEGMGLFSPHYCYDIKIV